MIRRHTVSLGVLLLCVLSGTSCTTEIPQLKDLAAAVVPIQPAGTRSLPLRFGRLEGRLRHGAEIGRYQWGLLCAPPYRTITWNTGRRLVANHEFGDVFFDALKNLGYDVAGDPGRMFDEDEEVARAELVISAQVDEIALSLCRRRDWLFDDYIGYTGAGILRVAWTVYSRLERRALYQTTTTGTGKVETANTEAREVILEQAFGEAAAKLGKDQGFIATVFVADSKAAARPAPTEAPPAARVLPTLPRPVELRPESDQMPDPGPHPPQPPPVQENLSDSLTDELPDKPDGNRTGASRESEPESAPDTMPKGQHLMGNRRHERSGPEGRSGDPGWAAYAESPELGPLTELKLPRQAPPTGSSAAIAAALVKTAVVIGNSTGHGSGLFLGQDADGNGGWVLTNAHVVGDSERVRVVSYNGRARIGTVVRRHRPRDVALVHVGGELPAVVSVRETPAQIGEAVAAIGAPLAQANRSTLTHGIISRFAVERGSDMKLIQSDVSIQHGNSGGPLFDGNGSLIGLCVAGQMTPDDRSEGLNYFIPIKDALEKLKITLGP